MKAKRFAAATVLVMAMSGLAPPALSAPASQAGMGVVKMTMP